MNELFVGLEHIAIACRQPEQLAAWYCRCLGFTLHLTLDTAPGKPKVCFVRAPGGGPFLEIMPADTSPAVERANLTPGLSHLAILVSDFDGAVAELARQGVRRDGDERAAFGGARIQFYRDPEGNLFHILYRPTAL
jgi:glyoxylase I family protein